MQKAAYLPGKFWLPYGPRVIIALSRIRAHCAANGLDAAQCPKTA